MTSITWLLPQTPVSEDDLDRFESFLNLYLPEDFKPWLVKHNGACPKPSEISLTGGFTFVINSFISFSKKDTPNVLSILNMLKDRLPKELIPIAEDHGGNYICFRYSSKDVNPDVVFWDHEEVDPTIATKEIAFSFTELINLLN
jgi:hypothetical protein